MQVSALSLAIRKYVAEHKDIKAIKFVTCATAMPPKRDVLAYLGIPLATGERPEVLQKELFKRGDVDVSTSLCIIIIILLVRTLSSSTL